MRPVLGERQWDWKRWEGCNKQSEAKIYEPWQVIECEGGIEQGGIQRGFTPGSLGRMMVSLREVEI